MPRRQPRDLELLDALDALERAPYEGPAWRAIREGRSPLVGHPSGGRWDPGIFDVIYTSLDAEGALAELYFHLSRQPVFPSRVRFHLHQLAIRTRSTLRFADLRGLEPLGVEACECSSLLYERTQEIGDAAAFLGFDGIIAPSARSPTLNLVLFVDHLQPDDLELVDSSPIDWLKWDRRRRGEE